MSEHTYGGEKPHTLSSDMDIEKGKEKLQANDLYLGTGGEGTNRTNK